MSWGSLWLAVAILTAEPDTAEFRLAGTGKFWSRSVAFSPDGEWIAALRHENPVPLAPEGTWHIDVWRVADVDGFSGSAGSAPPPTVTTEIKDSRRPQWICFSKAGEVVLLADAGVDAVAAVKKEAPATGPPRTARKAKASRPSDVENGAESIRFYDHERLTELRRWTSTDRGTHAQADLFEFPEASTVIHFAGSGVRLLDDATGEEYERLQFDRSRQNHPLFVSTGDARTVPGEGRKTCLIVAASVHRHALWKVSADRKVTKLGEIDHHRLAGNCVISPTENVVALATFPNQWGQTPVAATELQFGGTLEIGRIESLKNRQQLLSEDDVSVRQLAFSPDGKRLVSAGAELTTYDLPSPTRDTVLHPTLAKASELIVWNVATGRKLLRRSLAGCYVFDIRFSPDGRRLLTLEGIDEPGGPHRIRLWDFQRMLAAER